MAQDFTEGKIGKQLLLFAVPIMAGMLLQTAFNIVDAFFIGTLGPLELAAVSLAFPLVFAFIAIGSGLSIGANALISQAIGKKNLKKASNFSEHAIILAIALGIITAILGIFFAKWLFEIMGADETVLGLALQYAIPVFAGAVFTFLWYVSDAILRSEGDSKTPMKNLLIAVILNAILDPFLIFGIWPFPKLGLLGAAIATVFASFVSSALNFASIYGKKKILLKAKAFKLDFDCLKQTISIGLPASISMLLSSFGFVLLTGIVGTFGSFAIAAYGAGMRVTALLILPIIGMESAVSSIVGQNIGAKKIERAKKATEIATIVSIALTVPLAAIVMIFPEAIIRIFTQDESVIAIGRTYLSIMPLAYIIFSAYFSFTGAFQGAGKTKLVLATNIIYWIVAVGAAIALSKIFGIEGIWIGTVAAAAAELLLVAIIFYSGIWIKTKKE